MQKDDMLMKVAAILTTLDETGGAPESMLYIFLDMNMDLWSKFRYVMVESDLIQIKSNFVTLTENGKATAKKLNQAISN